MFFINHSPWSIWPCPRMVNWDPCTYNGELKQRRFWATHVNRKLSGPFSFMGSGLAWIFGKIVFIRIRTLSNTNLVTSSHIIKGKASLPVDVRRSETPLPKLPNIYIMWDVYKKPIHAPQSRWRSPRCGGLSQIHFHIGDFFTSSLTACKLHHKQYWQKSPTSVVSYPWKALRGVDLQVTVMSIHR